MRTTASSRGEQRLLLALQHHCYYHTNGENVKRDDPYAILGLSWGDGATTAEIRRAFQKRAFELHPDRNRSKGIHAKEEAHVEFQKLVRAYEALTKHNHHNDDRDETVEAWRRAVWQRSDRIALDRTDVAGQARKRPAPPASASADKRYYYGNTLGHPQHGGGGSVG